MLFKNDIFLDAGKRLRLLHVETTTNTAWVISLDDPKALPASINWDSIESLNPLQENSTSSSNTKTINPTAAMLKARDIALKVIGDVTKYLPDIFDPQLRGQYIKDREAAGHARSAIYKNLRRFWKGGQTPAALLGDYNRCGKQPLESTLNRGNKPSSGSSVYQLEKDDLKALADCVERHYLGSKPPISKTDAYQRLLEDRYRTADGNGKLWILPTGERPSLRQFRHFMDTHYSKELIIRRRHGNKEFERNHRPILDNSLSKCLGVGHQYEADATIADVFLVSAMDISKIIGKPTIYFIIDRYSRYIPGFYIGIENPSWICMLEAIFSISQNKRMLCDYYGVPYDPNDWPAHQVFPAEFVADRSEGLTKASDSIANELGVNVVNLPAQRPDHKGVIETSFKLSRAKLEGDVPGFDPPENAKKRQGKHYEKDACLTLKQFGAIILLGIIEHNRRPMQEYKLSPRELTDNLIPTPINIWNHNIIQKTGQLARFTEEKVRFALLPRKEATLTAEGIKFENCCYTCPEAVANGWFVSARKKHFKATVTFDYRLVDKIYIHDPSKNGSIYECILTKPYEKYQGMSFHEVKFYAHLRSEMDATIEQGRRQTRSEYHDATKSIIDAAKNNLKNSGLKKSRSARRADTKGERAVALRIERQQLASKPIVDEISTIPDESAIPRQITSPNQPANVIPIQLAKLAGKTNTPTIADTAKPVKIVETPFENSETPDVPESRTSEVKDLVSNQSSIKSLAQRMRERMRNG